MNKIPLIKPYMDQLIKDRVCQVLDSGYLTEGPVVRELEQRVQSYVSSNYAIAVTSCTTGLELALRALGIGPGDEVIVPDYTYPATAYAVALVGATVVLADVSRDTMLIDYDALESALTPKTKAVIPVSGFGNPLDYDRLMRIRSDHGLYIIEDAACALGAEFDGRRVGSLADITVFSFHPRKFITTGEGGMVTTDNPEWHRWMNSYKHFGMASNATRLDACFEMMGTNYKLSDILAAVGVGQMVSIEKLLAKRITLSERYLEMLVDVPGIKIPSTTAKGKHSRQTLCIYVEQRDRVMAAMRNKGIEVQIGTYALHLQPAFKIGSGVRIVSSLANSRYAFEHCLALPLYHELTSTEQTIVVERLIETISDINRSE